MRDLLGDCAAWQFPGWRCSRQREHDGPCALRPTWWNVVDRWRTRRWSR